MKKLALILIVILMFSSFAYTENGDALYIKQQEKINIDSGINSLKGDKSREYRRQEIYRNEMELLGAAKNRDSEQYQTLMNEYEEVKIGLIEVNQSITDAEDEYNNSMETLGKRLRALYASSDEFVLGSIIKSKSIMEFFEKIEYMSILSENDRRLVKKVEMAKMDLNYKRDLQLEIEEDTLKNLTAMDERIQKLETTEKDLEVKLEMSKEEIRALEKKEDELLELSRDLVSEIRDLQRNSKYAGGKMLWPVPSNRVIGTRLFGRLLHPIYKVYKMHTGVDIGARNGSSIIAVNSGIVIFAGWRGGYGNALMVDHGGGIVSLYAHCSKLLVVKGQGVERGQNIAKVGSTGLSTGPHLHFEIRDQGEPVDPLFHVGSQN